MSAPDLAAIRPGDEILVRVKVTATLPGDIPLFDVGPPTVLGSRPHWIGAAQVVGHFPAAAS